LAAAARGGVTALGERLRDGIARDGPMPLDAYMAACLLDPQQGYYMRRDPLGRGGDFVTAPEISQMFGELLGLWAAQLWADLGGPPKIRLVELGPGRGTLMRDALRAAAKAPGFVDAAEVWLVERSPVLRAAQSAAVPSASFADSFADVPAGPLLLLANEFFDALPIRQFVRRAGGWRERCVGLDRLGAGLVWVDRPPEAHPSGAPPDLPPDAREGAIVERCAEGAAVARAIGARLAAEGGGALIVDYGAVPPRTGGGDSFQAVRAHRMVDPLAHPGEADLTAHVDFDALARGLREGGAAVSPLLTQGALLRRLGIGARAAALARARPDRAGAIAAQHARLTGEDSMGALFKALAATGPGQPPPPGFEETRP
jgi:SAM-dependent MidA family methyltransferase